MGRHKKPVSVVNAFLAARIVTLPELCHRFRCSRSTVLRRLRDHGYYSSYNASGRFVTIREVAEFDACGLWVCKDARFSKRGTLKDTVAHFAQSSERGMTHEELTALLGIRVQNTLLDLVTEGRIRREKVGPAFVYCNGELSVYKQQAHERKVALSQSEPCRPTSAQKIAVLLELIKDPNAERKEIVVRCKRRGVALSRVIVDAIFEKYELEKKRAR